MTLDNLRELHPYITATLNAAAAEDENTAGYIYNCLQRFYNGDYGTVCQQDTDANNADLQDGHGHILARYEQRDKLTGDIYIEAHIDRDYSILDIDYNNLIIMYCFER